MYNAWPTEDRGQREVLGDADHEDHDATTYKPHQTAQWRASTHIRPGPHETAT